MARSKVARSVLLFVSVFVLGGTGATASSSRSAATAPKRPTAIAISAQPSSTDVVYQAEITPASGASKYSWSLGPNLQGHEATCGVFRSNGSTATWTLQDKSLGATCPSKTTEPGSITLKFDFGRYRCTAVDTSGSAGGKYRYHPAAACKLTGKQPVVPKQPGLLSSAQIADRVGLARSAETQAVQALAARKVQAARGDLNRSLGELQTAKSSSSRTVGMGVVTADLGVAITKDQAALKLLGTAAGRRSAQTLIRQALASKSAALAKLALPARPTAIAISAQSSSTDVVYQAEVTPRGGHDYHWSLGPNPQGHEAKCGVFKSSGSVATWTLHDKSLGATCATKSTQPGSIKLMFSFGRYRCTAVDPNGSAGGKYRYKPATACKLT